MLCPGCAQPVHYYNLRAQFVPILLHWAVMRQKRQLLDRLRDGHFHSGTALGLQLGISRSAIWKEIRLLGSLGHEIHAVPGRGYRLAHPVEALDEAAIRATFNPQAQRLLGNINILDEIDSTNLYLLQQASTGAASGTACLAEQQHAGRGRHGRTWISPPGGNIYLSLLWRFSMTPTAVGGVSLAVAVAVVRALRAAGLTHTGLKWPNDVLWQGRKLAGILLDMAGEVSGPCHLVAGVGLNVAMPAHAVSAIDQPWVDLRTALDPLPARNLLAGLLLQHLLLALHEFQQRGLAPFMQEWEQLDLIKGTRITLNHGGQPVHGVAQGVAADGALNLLVNGVTRRYYSGEVSLQKPS